MPLALDEDLRALADSVRQLAARHAPIPDTRDRFEELAAGVRPPLWKSLCDQGLNALHLPESFGGAESGLMALAVVAEQLGRSLAPGPWLPTVTASAVVASTLVPSGEDLPGSGSAGEATAPTELLGAFAEGATGALVLDGLHADRVDGGWRVRGTSRPTLGLPGAEQIIVRATTEATTEESVWLRLDPPVGDDGAPARIVTGDGTDLTRSVGSLHVTDLVIPDHDVLPSPPPAQVDLIVTTLLAAEAAGIMAWAVDCTVEHTRTRVQFDRPIGSFQAVQHKAATMLVRAEIAAAAAWDAARAEHQDVAQQRLAAAQAAVNAIHPSVGVVLDCVTLLGGLGFTWEHDAHLYWRRAVSIAGVAGTEGTWTRRLAEVALDSARDFSLVAPDAHPELRAEVGAVLDEVCALPEDEKTGSTGWAPQGAGPRRTKLADAGLVAPHYPPPWGRGAGVEEQAVIADEFACRGLTQPSMVIGDWVLPTLLVHGSPGQQERFVSPTLYGEIVWCQLFSEPGAGSDLASLSTRATRVEPSDGGPGGWRLDGQKVWTSSAHEADWGVCLARTDPAAPKHKGLSYFLVDMRSPGVDVRPLKQATGASEFNEVFLDGVFVPDDLLVGEMNQGWKLAVTTLSNERLSLGGALSHGSSQRLRQLIEDGQHAAPEEDVLKALGRCTAREIALSTLNLRGALLRIGGGTVGAEISVQKVFNAIAQRDGSLDQLALLGPAATIADGGQVRDHIGLPAVLFGGGTIEIQLNVIAQRVLGLPR